VITSSYTVRNQLYQVAETAGTTYAYDAAGNKTGATNPNGTTVTEAYDAAGCTPSESGSSIALDPVFPVFPAGCRTISTRIDNTFAGS
jgi:YD repeat-containing protein